MSSTFRRGRPPPSTPPPALDSKRATVSPRTESVAAYCEGAARLHLNQIQKGGWADALKQVGALSITDLMSRPRYGGLRFPHDDDVRDLLDDILAACIDAPSALEGIPIRYNQQLADLEAIIAHYRTEQDTSVRNLSKMIDSVATSSTRDRARGTHRQRRHSRSRSRSRSRSPSRSGSAARDRALDADRMERAERKTLAHSKRAGQLHLDWCALLGAPGVDKSLMPADVAVLAVYDKMRIAPQGLPPYSTTAFGYQNGEVLDPLRDQASALEAVCLINSTIGTGHSVVICKGTRPTDSFKHLVSSPCDVQAGMACDVDVSYGCNPYYLGLWTRLIGRAAKKYGLSARAICTLHRFQYEVLDGHYARCGGTFTSVLVPYLEDPRNFEVTDRGWKTPTARGDRIPASTGPWPQRSTSVASDSRSVTDACREWSKVGKCKRDNCRFVHTGKGGRGAQASKSPSRDRATKDAGNTPYRGGIRSRSPSHSQSRGSRGVSPVPVRPGAKVTMMAGV